MGVSWINVNGRKVLYVDYRGVTDTGESLRILHEAIEIERNSDGGLLLLQNYEGTSANEAFVAEIKKLGPEVSGKLKKNAVVGLTGIKKIFLAAYTRLSRGEVLKAFDSEEEAKAWLVEA